MAATYRTSTTNTSGSPGVTVDPPSGLASGDLWLVSVLHDDNSCTINPPAGWTGLTQYQGSGSSWPTARGFWKVAGAGESSVSFTVTGGDAATIAVSVRIDGQHATPIDASPTGATAGSGTTFDAPDATVTDAGSLAVLVCGCNALRTLTRPAGTTGDVASVGDGAFNTLAVAYQSGVGSGSYTPGNWAYSSTAGGRIGQTIVVRPAAGGGGGGGERVRRRRIGGPALAPAGADLTW